MAADDPTTFGRWLKQRREALDLTQKELAHEVGCSVSTLRKMEAGLRYPSKQVVELLAVHLEVPPHEQADFLRFARAGHGTADPAQSHLSPPPVPRAPLSRPAPGLRPGAPGLHAGRGEEQMPAPTNLPSPLTSFVGRGMIMERIRSLLWRVDVRLVTLTGAPGIGKTRLAIEAASELHGDFADGVFFLSLAPVTDPAMVVPTIAQSLGLPEAGGRTPADTLNNYLQGKNMLLLLDNLEQVADAAPQVAQMMQHAPRLKVLATSRVPLHLYGEHDLAVPPMELPQAGSALPPDELRRFEAIQLFVRRAQSARADFALADGDEVIIAGICRRLDALPLAIELAAARCKLYSPAAILSRLQDRFSLLAGGPVDVPERQRTLHAAVEWSYDLLRPAEQMLFRSLGVFVGGFTAEAAAAVLGPAGLRPTEVEAGLESLADKSMLNLANAAEETRYTMLETIREYALEQLSRTGDVEKMRALHAGYYLTFAQEATSKLSGPSQRAQLDKLEAEHANLTAALESLLGDMNEWEGARVRDVERVESGARLCVALYPLWNMRNYYKEGRKWFNRAIERIEGLIFASSTQGGGRQGAVPDAWVKKVARELSPALASLFGTMLSGAGLFAFTNEEAHALHQASLAVRRQLRVKAEIANSLSNLGNVALDGGDYPSARRYYSESLSLARELENDFKISSCLGNVGMLECDEGNFAQAHAAYEESLSIAEKIGDKDQMGRVLNNLGIVQRYQGDYAAARRSLERAFRLHEELGKKHSNGLTLVNLGFLARDEGLYDEARRYLMEGLEAVWKVGDSRVVAECLEGLASIAGVNGEVERAGRLYGSAEALREAVKAPMHSTERRYHESYIAEARERSSDTAWQAAWDEGRAMAVEETVAQALEGTRGGLTFQG